MSTTTTQPEDNSAEQVSDRHGAAGTGATFERPYPVEVALTDGTVLRGMEYPADGPPLVFLHDLGDDLDTWRPVAPAVQAAGFRVICLELRGHGLSDGEQDPTTTLDDVTGALAEVRGAFGPVGLVVYGTLTQSALQLGSKQGAPVHGLISPTPPDGRYQLSTPTSVPCMRVVITGAQDEPAHEYVRAIHPRMRGQNMWISTGTALRGPALLRSHPHLLEQLVMFMRRHLTAHHLAWIAQQTTHRQDSGNNP